MPPTDTSSNLKKLFDAWGIEFDPTKVVGDLTGAWRVRAGSGEPNAGGELCRLVQHPRRHQSRRSGDRRSAAGDGRLVGLSGEGAQGVDRVHPAADQQRSQSGLIPVDQVKMPDPAKILANFKPEGGPRVIAARVHGVLKSAFTGPPPLAKDQKRPDNFPAYKAQTDGPANLVVVADSDILADRFWVRDRRISSASRPRRRSATTDRSSPT